LLRLDSHPEKSKDVWLLFRLLALDIVGMLSSRLNTQLIGGGRACLW